MAWDYQVAERCDRAPRGWWCSRDYYHEGPCAARPRWYNKIARFLTRRPY